MGPGAADPQICDLPPSPQKNWNKYHFNSYFKQIYANVNLYKQMRQQKYSSIVYAKHNK